MPVVCFALAMLSKESVIFFPWLAVLSPARDPIRTRVVRAAPLLGVSVASLALLMLVRPLRVAPDPAGYAASAPAPPSTRPSRPSGSHTVSSCRRSRDRSGA